jgi:hypothetical protein
VKKRFLLKAFCLCITGLCQAKAAALQPPIPDSLFIPYQDSLHVLAVPFHSSNLKLTCAKSDMEAMFDKSPNDSDLQSLYLAATHGNVKFTFETADTFTVNYTMDLNDSTSFSQSYTMVSLAKTHLKGQGYTLTGYDRVVFFHENHNIWGGYATGNEAVLFNCDNLQTLAHELGHTIGLHHAGGVPYIQEFAEYKDASDFMGGKGNPMTMFNAPHKVIMGWVDTSKIVQGPLPTGTYEIAPLHLESKDAKYPQVIIIPSLYDSIGYYFLSYRRAEGWDSQLQDKYKDKLNVHKMKAPVGSWRGPQSWFLGAAHDNWGHIVESKEFYVKQLSHDADKSTFALTVLSNSYEMATRKLFNGLSLQIIPNPFKTSTRVQVLGMGGQKAEIAIYNVNGSLVNKWSANRGTFVWDGKDFYGQDAASGTYVVSVKTGGRVLNKHAVIMR